MTRRRSAPTATPKPSSRQRPRTRTAQQRPTQRSTKRLPTAVWTCPPASTDALSDLPDALVAHAVESFSSRHDRVLTATAHNRHPTPSSPKIATMLAEVAARAGRTASPLGLDTRSSPAGLVVVTVDPHRRIDGDGPSTWMHALLPGGILAILGRTTHRRGRLIDPTGQLLRACQAAGLTYLQHIVAITAPLRDGYPCPSRTGPQRGREHARAHHDLLVFTRTEIATVEEDA